MTDDLELKSIPESARIKGTMLLPLIKVLRLNKEHASELLDNDLQKYLTERILISEWYPSREHHRLLKVLGKFVNDDWQFVGRALAQFEFTGPYRHLVKEGQPLLTLRTLPQLWGMNTNTGHVSVDRLDESSGLGARITVRDWAQPFPMNIEITRAYALQMLELCGAEAPQAEVVEVQTTPPTLVVIELRFDVPDQG